MCCVLNAASCKVRNWTSYFHPCSLLVLEPTARMRQDSMNTCKYNFCIQFRMLLQFSYLRSLLQRIYIFTHFDIFFMSISLSLKNFWLIINVTWNWNPFWRFFSCFHSPYDDGKCSLCVSQHGEFFRCFGLHVTETSFQSA